MIGVIPIQTVIKFCFTKWIYIHLTSYKIDGHFFAEISFETEQLKESFLGLNNFVFLNLHHAISLPDQSISLPDTIVASAGRNYVTII